jgi:hypothetical protein
LQTAVAIGSHVAIHSFPTKPKSSEKLQDSSSQFRGEMGSVKAIGTSCEERPPISAPHTACEDSRW